MCGFTGIFDLTGARGVRGELADAMARTLVHRGPDSCGSFCDGALAFGFRRLKIIDLAHGEQPMTNEDGSLVLVCNGEIFNYLELRRELTGRGHTFRTSCDVEVLVHLYEEEGAAFLSRLNGQFALALYDRRDGSLLLARDQMGVNPVFYAVAGGHLLFGSEIKALLAHPALPREVDLTGLDQVFTFPGLVSPRTLFRGVQSLKPGHFVQLLRPAGDGAPPAEIRQIEYWDLDYPRLDEQADGEPEERSRDRLAELLRRSIRYRLQADVEVGFYLSGGLDSSLIAALVAEATPGTPRHSFSITFPEREMTERRWQRIMAEATGAVHHEICFRWEELADRMRTMVYHAECPVKESYNTCSMALSQAARAQGITVILTGEGADELFAGYVGYRFDGSQNRGGADDELEAALEAEVRERLWGDPELFYESRHLPLRELKEALYSRELAGRLDSFDCTRFPVVDPTRLRGRHPLHQRSYLDMKLRLADHLLSDHGDRMALASSVEARYPFLDIDLVEAAARMPPDLKLRGLEEKYLLKRVAESLLPAEIVRREKFGFHAPGSPRLLRQNIPWVEDLLSYDRIRRQGYFDPDMVERLKRVYRADGFHLNLPFETDLLMIVLTFGLCVEVFDLPDL
jgi:asparagine synthase (glutamine-hydrolysing)